MRLLTVTCLSLALALTRPAAAGPYEDADAAYARGDYPSALRIYGELAAQGVAPAQFNLGVMHDFGQGTERDPVAAVRWYREAAAQGHGGAQFNLGGLYFEGVGVPQDHLRAYMWFTISAIAGTPGASRNRTSVGRLLTPDELARAQQMARECQVRKFSGCD
jgi:TPR repeat protein